MARFAGIVHGVVVQITTYMSCLFASSGIFVEKSLFVLNFTKIEGAEESAYSTSASASAVTQEEHQYTGFFPLKTDPSWKKFPSSRTIVA